MSKKGIKRTKKFDLGNSLYSKKSSLRILRFFESKFAIFRCDPVAALKEKENRNGKCTASVQDLNLNLWIQTEP